MTRQLFLDLDGVFADFDGGFPAMFGFDHREAGDEVMWKTIDEYGTFFRDLPACAGSLEFFETVRHLSPIILTACPRENYDKFVDIANQKKAWVREHLGDVQMIFAPGGRSKPLYMRNPGDILIDDFESNIQRWSEAGGTGIHHTGDFAPTYYTLYGALWPKIPFASGMSRARNAARETTSHDTTTATPTASPWGANTTSRETARKLCPTEAAANVQD